MAEGMGSADGPKPEFVPRQKREAKSASHWEQQAPPPKSARSGAGARARAARSGQVQLAFESGEEAPRPPEQPKRDSGFDREGREGDPGEWETDALRRWYDDSTEAGVTFRKDGSDPFQMDETRAQQKEAQYQKHMTRANGSRMTLKQSRRAEQLQRETNAWEENRLMTAGVVRRRDVRSGSEDETEQRASLQVHDAQPPFMHGKGVLNSKAEPVVPLKDSTSDIAAATRNQSRLLQQYRQEKDQHKSRERYWESQNTKMAEITGEQQQQNDHVHEGKNPETGEQPSVKSEHGEDSDREEAPTAMGDGKAGAQYHQHIGSKYSQAQSVFSKSKTVQQQRHSLPVFDVKEDLLQVLRENKICVIVGETGSGKTTQLAQFLYEDGYASLGKIGCTQPRRVAAMSVAKRVSEEMECELGALVGYTIRFEDVTSEDTQIKYMTDGILLRETLKDQDLDDYSCIIMDEAHERSLNTDVLFGILKRVAARRLDFKLIVTSATLNAEKFSEFFGSVPVFHIPGRTFPVEVTHSKTPTEDYVQSAVKQVLEIHLSHPQGDILVFMTGQEEIECVCWALQQRMQKVLDDSSVPPLLILPMYSQLPSDLQARIFEKAPEGTRKCVVSTNIAETSLTVDGILYVVDTGMCKLKVYNPRVGMDALQVYPCSQAGVDQRKGRAGRTAPGHGFRAFTEYQYKQELLQNTIPEIQRTNLSNVVLLLKSLNVDDPLDFDFMDPPPRDNIFNSLYELWVLGAIDDSGRLTPLGQRMVEFPVDPSLAKLILESERLGCSSEILTIVSMLSVPTIFFRPKEREDESDAAREKFFVPESDHLTLLNVYQQWASNNFRSEWCNSHFIHTKSMKRAQEIRTQLLDIMRVQKVQIVSAGMDWDVARRAICSACFGNAASVKGIGEYVSCRSGTPCHLHPTSALYGLGYSPDYVVYHELVMTSKEYMNVVTAVEPEWLCEFGSAFFTLRSIPDSSTQSTAVLQP